MSSEPNNTQPNPKPEEPAKKQRVRLPKLKAADFQHPWDVAALETVKRAKGLDLLVRKLNEYGFERWYYINNIADNVRVSQRQCKSIHDMLRESCDILGVTVEPQLYLNQNPNVNAFTFGTQQPFIVINSALVDFLTEDQLLCVIAHEVGHIKCGHVLYKMMANFLSVVVEIVGEATLGLGTLIGSGLLLAIYEWDRKSELSADRAGLLVVQDLDVSIETLMKLAGGCNKIYEQFNRDEFLKQADDYQELDSSMLNQVYKFLQIYRRSHPFPALRAKEIKKWAEIGEYTSILDGTFYQQYLPPAGYLSLPPAGGSGYGRPSSGGPTGGGPGPQPPSGQGPGESSGPRPDSKVCPKCSTTQVDPLAKFCFQCGTPFGSAPPPRPGLACFNCGTPIKKTDMFCPSCGLNTRLG